MKVSLRARLYRSSLYNLALWGPTPSTLRFRLEESWPGDASRGQDMLEALAAFKEKRPANFTGN